MSRQLMAACSLPATNIFPFAIGKKGKIIERRFETGTLTAPIEKGQIVARLPT